MSDDLEQRVAAEIRTFYTDRGGPYLDAARSVIALCREDIAAEIDAAGEAEDERLKPHYPNSLDAVARIQCRSDYAACARLVRRGEQQ